MILQITDANYVSPPAALTIRNPIWGDTLTVCNQAIINDYTSLRPTEYVSVKRLKCTFDCIITLATFRAFYALAIGYLVTITDHFGTEYIGMFNGDENEISVGVTDDSWSFTFEVQS